MDLFGLALNMEKEVELEEEQDNETVSPRHILDVVRLNRRIQELKQEIANKSQEEKKLQQNCVQISNLIGELNDTIQGER